MEQMTNFSTMEVEDRAAREPASTWRSFGSIASALMVRVEAQRMVAASPEELPFVPVAWAAE
jgi:hypothetical protein